MAALLLAPGGLESDGPEWLSELAAAGVDKLVHAGLFFVQSYCISRALRGRAGGAWSAAVLAAGYGFALELLQLAIPGRGWEVGDLAANAIGAFLWPLASWALGRTG